MDFPVYRMPPPPVLTPFSAESLGYALSSVLPGYGASVAWPTANKAFYYPFSLTDWATAYQLLWFVGATSSGNIDVGIYTSEKGLIVSSGSTAMSATTSTVQELDIADTVLPPGDYLLGAACDNNTGTVFQRIAADELGLSMYPVYEQATAFALPNPCVPVVSTEASPPIAVVGIQFRSVF